MGHLFFVKKFNFLELLLERKAQFFLYLHEGHSIVSFSMDKYTQGQVRLIEGQADYNSHYALALLRECS